VCFSALPFQQKTSERTSRESLALSIGRRRKNGALRIKGSSKSQRPAAARMSNRKLLAKLAEFSQAIDWPRLRQRKYLSNQLDMATSAHGKCKFSRPISTTATGCATPLKSRFV
jgi:hypothetical protein